MRFQTRLTLTLLALWFVCILVVHTITGIFLVGRERGHLANAVFVQASQTADSVVSHLAERHGDLTLLAQQISKNNQERTAITQQLNAVRDAYGAYEWLRWIDQTGKVVADTNQLQIGEVDPTFHELAQGETSTLLLRPAINGLGMQALMAVHASNGWVLGSIPLQRLHRLLADPSRWPIDTVVELVDQAGRLQFRSDSIAGVGRAHPQMDRILAASNTTELKDSGRSLIIAPIPQLGFLIGTVPEHAWLEPVRQVQWIILGAGLLGLIVGAFLIAWTTRNLARPLHRLTVQAQAIGQGKELIDAKPERGEPLEVRQMRSILIEQDEKLSMRIRELDKADERMRLAEEAALLGVWDYTPATDRLEWDSGMFALYATSRESFTGRTEDWLRRVHPEDLVATEALLRKTITLGGTFSAVFRIIRDDGTLIWVESLAKLQPKQDSKHLHLVGVNRDITTRINAESALASKEKILQRTGRLASVGGWKLDVSTRKLTWTEEAGVILKTANTGAIALEEALAVFPPVERVRIEQALTNAIAGKAFDLEVPLPPETGTSRWMRLIGEADYQNNVCVALSGAIQDITMQREVAENLRAATYAAQAAATAKGEFLATMSHEIRTPMNGVIGIAELLQGTALDDQQRKLVDTLRDSGKALMTIINDILDFSKFESGKVELEHIPYAPAVSVERIITLLMPQAENKRLRLSVEAEADLVLVGDPGRFEQILLNLIGNALKFTDKGGVTVRISRRDVQACVEIIDTGIGMDPAKHDKLFRLFSQLDASTTRKYGGTGLGLAICKRLIDAMEGRIEVVSGVGQGSTFRLWLPLPTTPIPSPRIAVNTPSVAVTAPTRLLRVLVVEDNPTNQLVAQCMLAKLGHSVELANDGREGVAAWERASYDLILMDMQMPVMNGLEATEFIRAQEAARSLPRIPIIALTANVMEGDVTSCLAAGMDGTLAKPISIAGLHATLAGFASEPK